MKFFFFAISAFFAIFASNLFDQTTRWTVTNDIAQWQDEIAWMSLYFSVAVWSSLALGSFPLLQDRLPCPRHFRWGA